MSQDQVIAVSIIHQHALLLEALRRVLARFGDLQIVSTCSPIDAGDVTVPDAVGDVAILGYGGPGQIGLAHAAQLRCAYPDCHVLMIDVPDREEDILACVKAGAGGYLTLGEGVSELVHNIRAIASGQAICSARIASLLFSQVASRPPRTHRQQLPESAQLTRRELQVMVLIEEGLTNKQIARRLQIEQQTVKNHVHNILVKLALRRRTEVAHYARCHGLVPITGGGLPASNRDHQ